jgi:uncharacterized membrane protein YdjX (TVP38/TMEM64 family)
MRRRSPRKHARTAALDAEHGVVQRGESIGWERDLVIFVALVVACGAALAAYIVLALGEGQLRALRWPSNLEAAQATATALSAYVAAHWLRMYVAFGFAFLYVQAFFIPVSSFLNLLAGAWFGLWPGLFICCLCTASGSTACFLSSRALLARLIRKFAPRRVAQMRALVDAHRADLALFLTSLFVMPCPHTVIKVVCPHVGVPVRTFFWSCFLGLIPYNFILVKAGVILDELSASSDIFSRANAVQLATLAALLLTPKLAKWLLGKRIAM